MARSRAAPTVDRRAVEVRARRRLLRLRLSCRLQDRDQAARGGLRREVHEQRPLRLEGDRPFDQNEPAMKASAITAAELRAGLGGAQPPIVIDARRRSAFMALAEMIDAALRPDPEPVGS